jgi:hypothetical protein
LLPSANVTIVMLTDDLTRTAYHEAGHTVAGWLYGRMPEIVSTRPAETYRGITSFEPLDPGDDFAAGFEPGFPVPLQAAETRRRIEARVVISLAGPIAGDYAAPIRGYAPLDDDRLAAERVSRELAHLSPRHRELLVALETDTTSRDADEVHARELAGAWIGEPNEAVAYLHWLRVVAERLVCDYWRAITALAAALLEQRVLSGDDAVSIIRSA